MTDSPYNAPGAQKYDQVRKIRSSVARRIVELANIREDMCLLDLACGTGQLAVGIRTIGNFRFVGIDRSVDMLRRAASKGVYDALIRGDITKLPFNNSAFDAVVGSHFLHHLDANRSQLLAAEVYRTLRQGMAILVTTAHEDIRRNPLSYFFPDFASIDLARFPRIEEIRDWLLCAGFFEFGMERVSEEPVVIDEAYADWVQRKPLSTLEMISDERFCEGMNLLREHVRATRNCPDTYVRVNALVFGRKG